MKKILKEPNPPTAVISGLTDTFTLGLIQAIYNEGMKSPEDISVVTLGGSDSIADIRPTLTAIKMPWEDLGKKAVQMLMKVIDGVKLRKNHVVIPSEFIINESTAAPLNK
jgi:DNA-binding LacI/PurR family transcriptional regulator